MLWWSDGVIEFVYSGQCSSVWVEMSGEGPSSFILFWRCNMSLVNWGACAWLQANKGTEQEGQLPEARRRQRQEQQRQSPAGNAITGGSVSKALGQRENDVFWEGSNEGQFIVHRRETKRLHLWHSLIGYWLDSTGVQVTFVYDAPFDNALQDHKRLQLHNIRGKLILPHTLWNLFWIT